MKKVVLLPVLVLASAMVLAGCDTSTTSTASESGSETASSSVSEGTGSDSASASASESEPEPDEHDDISSITAAGTYSVEGQVVAEHTQGFIVRDDTGAVYVHHGKNYDKDLVAIGDVVEVAGTISDGDYNPYNGYYQFDSKATVEKTEGTAPAAVAATPLTAEIVENWATVATDDKQQLLPRSEIKEYTWTATAGKAGNFDILNLEGCDIDIEPLYVDSSVFSLKVGTEYKVNAYFYGYNVKYGYAGVMLTGLEALSTPDPDPEPEEVKYLDEILTLAQGDTYTGRAVYMGSSTLANDRGYRNATFVADGDDWYQLYQIDTELYDALGTLVPGETVLEWKGTISDYGATKESKVSAISVVTDAEVTAGTWTPLAEGYVPNLADVNKGFQVTDATIAQLSSDKQNISFTLGDNATEYDIYLNKYNTDLTVDAIANLEVGDKLTFKTFGGDNYDSDQQTSEFEFIYMIDPVRTPGEGGEDPEPEPTLTTIADLYEMEIDTDATVSGVIVGIWKQGIVIDDNTGTIYRYDNESETLGFEVGDYVTVSGAIGEFNGIRQFNYSSDITAAEGTAPILTTTTPTEWTAADMDAFVPSSRSPLVKIAGNVDSIGQYNNVTVPGAEKTLSLFLSESISATLEVGKSYDFTGYALYISSGKYVNVLITSATEIQPSAPTAIEISSPLTEIMVGRTVELSVSYEPAISEKGVSWASSNDEVATVDENGVVTAIAEGEVTITATSTADESVKDEIALTVIAAPETTLAGTIDFSSLTGKGTKYGNAADLQSDLSACMDSENGLSITVSAVTNVYDGNGAGGYLANTPGLIKTGKSGEGSSITATISASVVRIEMDCAKWNDSASDTISLNGVTYAAPAYDSENAEWGTLAWDFAEGTTDFNVETNDRVFIKAIRFYVAA